jgi:hypothetical protein
LEGYIEETLFLDEIDGIGKAQGLSKDDVRDGILDIYSRQLYSDGGATILESIRSRAKKRVKEWMARCEELERTRKAKTELKEALQLLNGLENPLESSESHEEAVHRNARKHKIDEAVEQVEKAAKVIKRKK